jgi:hypothetical protein
MQRKTVRPRLGQRRRGTGCCLSLVHAAHPVCPPSGRRSSTGPVLCARKGRDLSLTIQL